MATVLLYRQSCDDFLQYIDDTIQLFNDLEGDYKFVEEQTRALQNTCEDLLAKQVSLCCYSDMPFRGHLELIQSMDVCRID